MKLFRAMSVPIYLHVPVLCVGSGQWMVACGGVEITPARPDNTEALIEHEGTKTPLDSPDICRYMEHERNGALTHPSNKA